MARPATPRVSIAALRRVPARRIDGAFWHQGAVTRELLSFASPSLGDGRYHVSGDDGAWYGSSKEGAAWIEMFRHHLSKELSPLEVRRRVGRVEVKALRVLDLTDPGVQAALGLDEDDLVNDDRRLCQAVSTAARRVGFDGILAPSAAMAGESTLVVFPSGMRRVGEVHSRVQVPPRSLRRALNRARLPGATRRTVRQWRR